MDGGFAEYCAYPAAKVFPIQNLSDVDATLLEPASCAAHGLEKIAPKMGSSVLMFGAGPTGLVLAQLLRHNGGCKVVIAAPGGLKMELAKKLDAADVYVELSRSNPEEQFKALKEENKYGFDIVVEATGSPKILEDAINYVRRGGKLVVYGVYSESARVSWAPSKICMSPFNLLVLVRVPCGIPPQSHFVGLSNERHLNMTNVRTHGLVGDEITILGSFSETYMFPAAIDYLDSGKVKVQGIVNKTFTLDQWGECLESMRNKSAIKAAIVFE
jgi:D-arabinitol dehydrogenase (NADP+)